MNRKLILFSAIITAAVGAVLGLGLAEIKADILSHRSAAHGLHRKYALVGAGMGFLMGAGLESVRELKKQQDREETLRDYIHTYLSLRDLDNKFDQ